MSIRAFIALELPEKIIKDLGRIQKKLQKLKVKGSWVDPQNFHLTLVFLGCVEQRKLNSIKNTINLSVSKKSPIELSLGRLNCFPSANRTQALYFGLKRNQALNCLTHELRERLQQRQIWFDQKPFLAHLTLARFRSPQNLTKIVDLISLPETQFIVSKITLFQSTLSRSGPIHNPLEYFRLSK